MIGWSDLGNRESLHLVLDLDKIGAFSQRGYKQENTSKLHNWDKGYHLLKQSGPKVYTWIRSCSHHRFSSLLRTADYWENNSMPSGYWTLLRLLHIALGPNLLIQVERDYPTVYKALDQVFFLCLFYMFHWKLVRNHNFTADNRSFAKARIHHSGHSSKVFNFHHSKLQTEVKSVLSGVGKEEKWKEKMGILSGRVFHLTRLDPHTMSHRKLGILKVK